MVRDIFYNYFPNLLSELYFHLDINLVPESKYPIDPGGVKRICIFGTAGIGNLIMLTPMIQTLRHGTQNSKITVVVSDNGAKDAIENSYLVDKVVVLDSKHKLKKIRDDWPDLAIAATHRGFMRAKQAFRTGAMYKLGFRYDHRGKLNTGFMYTHAVSLDESKHEVEQGLDLIRSLGFPEIRKLYMHIEDADRAVAEKMILEAGEGAPLVGIHAGLGPSDPKGRCWPIERFAQLCDILMEDHGAKPIIVGSPAEVSVANEIASTMAKKPLILAGKTTLRQTAAVLEKCHLFIGNDGGPVHIAAAMGTPVIAIFGPTNPVRYGPYGDNHQVVKSNLPCSPCHKPHEPGIECQKLGCMEAIGVDMVIAAASARLKHKP